MWTTSMMGNAKILDFRYCQWSNLLHYGRPGSDVLTGRVALFTSVALAQPGVGHEAL
jgi:hypothetical protein